MPASRQFSTFCLIAINLMITGCDATKLKVPLIRRFSTKPTQDQLQLAQTGTEPVIDRGNVDYIGIVTIGTPPQQFNVLFDTGSSDLWFADVNCTDATCVGIPKYNSSLSSTYVNLNQNWSIAYGNGDCSQGACVTGIVGQDVACLGSTPSLCFATQVFGQALIDGGNVNYDNASGIIGLGLVPAVDTAIGATTFIQNIEPQLDQPLMTVWLTKVNITDTDFYPNGGAFTFGGFDTTHCSCSITYTPAEPDRSVQFNVSGISIGNFHVESIYSALLDTGGISISVPNSLYSSIIAVVGAQISNFDPTNLPCDGTYPDLVLLINGFAYQIPPSKYIIQTSLGVCKSNIVQSSDESMLLGAPMFNTYCIIVDFGNTRIGFAQNLD